MKWILLLAALTATHILTAQAIPNPWHKKSLPKLVIPDSLNTLPSRPPLLPAFPEASLSAVLPNRTRIYNLPQDNMPCLAPDMKQFSMPNIGGDLHLYSYNGPGAIPNPVRPFKKINPLAVPRIKK